jgi:hypothetical protein
MNFGWRLAHLPVLLAANGALLVAAVAVGWLADGGTGAAGAAAGVGVVVASYLLSTLVIAWADTVHPSLVLAVGVVTYIVKFSVIGAVMVALTAADWPGLPAMGVGVVAGVVTWTGTHIWWLVRHQPVVEHDRPATPAPPPRC